MKRKSLGHGCSASCARLPRGRCTFLRHMGDEMHFSPVCSFGSLRSAGVAHLSDSGAQMLTSSSGRRRGDAAGDDFIPSNPSAPERRWGLKSLAAVRRQNRQREKKKKDKGRGKWLRVEPMKDVGSLRGWWQPRSKQFHGG